MQQDKHYEWSRWMNCLLKALPYQCWQNAKRALAYLGADARYVEGWVVRPDGLLVEQSWCEADGRIIDPTLPDAEMTYFAGLRFAAQQLATLDRDPYTPLAWQLYGRGGCDSPEYRGAFEEARAFAGVNHAAYV